ncbi:DUF4265 domain-containing protein [Streptomyces sp. NPDC006335]|uniref:DUF4265 domain-containing protein n=1 Tax=Streptomyces sp. NPDC006335 TaxID=3156895 RepID=UPI0033B3EB3D
MDLGDGTARVDNTPWFVRGIASDDIVRVEVDDEGLWWAGETEQFRMVALDVPPTADLPGIRRLLEPGAAEEWCPWEEGCVTAAWRAMASD